MTDSADCIPTFVYSGDLSVFPFRNINESAELVLTPPKKLTDRFLVAQHDNITPVKKNFHLLNEATTGVSSDMSSTRPPLSFLPLKSSCLFNQPDRNGLGQHQSSARLSHRLSGNLNDGGKDCVLKSNSHQRRHDHSLLSETEFDFSEPSPFHEFNHNTHSPFLQRERTKELLDFPSQRPYSKDALFHKANIKMEKLGTWSINDDSLVNLNDFNVDNSFSLRYDSDTQPRVMETSFRNNQFWFPSFVSDSSQSITQPAVPSRLAAHSFHKKEDDASLRSVCRSFPFLPVSDSVEKPQVYDQTKRKLRHKTDPNPINSYILSQNSSASFSPLFPHQHTVTKHSINLSTSSPSSSNEYSPLSHPSLMKLSSETAMQITPEKLFCADNSLRLDVFKVYPCKDMECNEANPFTAPHDKKTCPYYHSHRDRRRNPLLFNYKAEQCEHHSNLDNDGNVLCPLRNACNKCHNHHELLYHPTIYKQRFCSSYNQVECHRGKFCAFGHSRLDIRCELFSVEDEKNPGPEFFMNSFKTLWCPYGVQHDWHGCLYAHTYQDCRRKPSVGYSSEPCPYWKKDLHSADYERRCPSGSRCPFAHGSKEQLYHASCYKIMRCADYRARKVCPRGIICAFYHEASEKRYASAVPNTHSLLPESLMVNLQKNFLKPPLFNMDNF